MEFSSFLVRDGAAIRVDLHEERLSGLPDLSAIPVRGEWFPKVTRTEVEVRPAPRLRAATTLWLPELPDPRTAIHAKGPDHQALAALREAAHRAGADDAVLHCGGCVREGAHCSLVFFGDEGPLGAPLSDVLASTTVRAACEAGFLPPLTRREISIEEALSLPAVAASALHGFTPVTRWVVGAKTIKAADVRSHCDAAALNAAMWRELAAPVVPAA